VLLGLTAGWQAGWLAGSQNSTNPEIFKIIH